MEIQFDTTILTLPSGREITMKESNGEEDAALSRVGDVQQNLHFPRFLSLVVVADSFIGNRTPDFDYISTEWRPNDILAAILYWRIWTYGKEMNFKHTFSSDLNKLEISFLQDLTEYLVDYKKYHSLTEKEDKIKFLASVPSNAIPPYDIPQISEIELQIRENLRVKYTLSNWLAGKELVGRKAVEDINDNDMLLMHNISASLDDKPYMPMNTFGILKSPEKKSILKSIRANDKNMDLTVEVTHPNTKAKEELPLIQMEDFLG